MSMADMMKREGRRRPRIGVRGMRAKACSLGRTVVSMLLVVTLLFGYLCFSYLKVQASINATMNRIANMEEQLAAARSENAVRVNRLEVQMDLDKVFHIAVDEMGMVYPDENEVIEYTEQMREYVRQYENIPKS